MVPDASPSVACGYGALTRPGGTLKRTKGPDRLVRAPVQLMNSVQLMNAAQVMESVQLMNAVQWIDYPSAAMACRMSSREARQAGQMAATTPAIMDATV